MQIGLPRLEELFLHAPGGVASLAKDMTRRAFQLRLHSLMYNLCMGGGGYSVIWALTCSLKWHNPHTSLLPQ